MRNNIHSLHSFFVGFVPENLNCVVLHCSKMKLILNANYCSHTPEHISWDGYGVTKRSFNAKYALHIFLCRDEDV